ncbi:hypothetical protein HDU67_007435, partial [Dinochytrium kinnereticum]
MVLTPSPAFGSTGAQQAAAAFDEANCLTNAFVLGGLSKIRWRRYYIITDTACSAEEDIGFNEDSELLPVHMGLGGEFDDRAHPVMSVPDGTGGSRTIRDPLLCAHFTLLNAKIPSIWRLAEYNDVESEPHSVGNGASDPPHERKRKRSVCGRGPPTKLYAKTVPKNSTTHSNSSSSLFGSSSQSEMLPESRGSTTPASVASPAGIPATPPVPSATLSRKQSVVPLLCAEPEVADMDRCDVPDPPLGVGVPQTHQASLEPTEYGARSLCRELWFFELGGDAEKDLSGVSKGALDRLFFLEEGEFSFDTIYVQGPFQSPNSIASMEGRLFVGAILNLLERSFASQGSIRLGDRFLLLPLYDKSISPTEYSDLSEKLNFKDRIRTGLLSISLSIQLIGTNLVMQPKISHFPLRSLTSKDLRSARARDYIDAIISPSGVKAKVICPETGPKSQHTSQTESLELNQWASLLNLPLELLNLSQPTPIAVDSEPLPKFVTIVLEDKLCVRYPTSLVFKYAENSYSMNEVARRAEHFRRFWRKNAFPGPNPGNNIDFWKFQDPFERLLDVTLKDLGRGDALIEERQKEEEVRRKREEEANTKVEEKRKAQREAKTSASLPSVDTSISVDIGGPSTASLGASMTPLKGGSNDYSFLSVNAMPFLSTSAPQDTNDLTLDDIGDMDFDFFTSSSATPPFTAPSPGLPLTAPSPFAIPATPAPIPASPAPFHTVNPLSVASTTSPVVPASPGTYKRHNVSTPYEETTSPAVVTIPSTPHEPAPMLTATEPFHVDSAEKHDPPMALSDCSDDDCLAVPEKWAGVHLDFEIVWGHREKYGRGGMYSYFADPPPARIMKRSSFEGGSSGNVSKRRRMSPESSGSESDDGDDSDSDDEFRMVSNENICLPTSPPTSDISGSVERIWGRPLNGMPVALYVLQKASRRFATKPITHTDCNASLDVGATGMISIPTPISPKSATAMDESIEDGEVGEVTNGMEIEPVQVGPESDPTDLSDSLFT